MRKTWKLPDRLQNMVNKMELCNNISFHLERKGEGEDGGMRRSGRKGRATVTT
jgi:hypothetical protein